MSRTEKRKKEQHSMGHAWVYLVIMLALTAFSLLSGAEAGPFLLLSAAIIAGTYLFCSVVQSWPKIFEIVLALASPALIFMLTESYTHSLYQMWQGPVLFNIILYYLIFAVIFLISGSTRLAVQIEAIFMASAGMANYFVILFRSTPIFPWDFFSLRIAMSVANNYNYTISIRALNVALLFIALIAAASKMKIKFRPKAVRIAGTAAFCAAFAGTCLYVQTDAAAETFNFDTTLFTPKVYYRNNGLLLSFVVNMRYVNVEKPEGYTQELAEQTAENYAQQNPEASEDETVDIEEKPNIIVIVNEAFSDLRVLGDYETNKEVMPFIDSLEENTQKGYYYSSVKGGNTANTEFEFLTGNSMYFLPIGSVPFQQYIRSSMPSISSQLSDLGYTSVAMHPYNASGWNRDKVYPWLGFDECYFLDSFADSERLRLYVSDQALYDKIIERYDQKEDGERFFFYAMTMQNHGSYWRRYTNFDPDVKIIDGSGTYLSSTEQYLSLIRRSDEAFEYLVNYFKDKDDPTIILMFGDHQPADYVVEAIQDSGESTLEEQQLRYKVPYVMWANYDIDEEQDGITSANYLGVKLMKAAGIPLTNYQYFLEQLSQKLPVITANMAMTSDGTYYERGSDAIADIVREYSILEYNDVADTKHRLSGFFD